MTKINIKIFFFALNLLIHLNNKSFAKNHTSSTDGVYEDEETLVNTTLEDSNPFNNDLLNDNTHTDPTLYGDTPADDTFPDDTFPDDTPADDTPADDTPADDTFPDDTPADDTFPDDTFPDDTFPDDTPADDTPADDTFPDDTPADDTPADDTPADDTPADDTPADDTSKPTSSKNRKKKKSLTSYINPEELQKSKEIMDEAVFHLKRYSDYNNGHNCYYFINDELYLCFMEENGIKFEKFYLVIPDPNKYGEVVNMFNKFKGISYVGDIDVETKTIRQYCPNLELMYIRYKSFEVPFSGYSFVLSSDVKTNDTAMFVQTAISLDDQNIFDTRRFKNAIVKSANSLNIDVNANEYGQMKSKKKMFPNLTGIIIQKKSDCVCVTYINSIYSGKSLPKSFRIPRLKAKKMIYLANLIKDTINQ